MTEACHFGSSRLQPATDVPHDARPTRFLEAPPSLLPFHDLHAEKRPLSDSHHYYMYCCCGGREERWGDAKSPRSSSLALALALAKACLIQSRLNLMKLNLTHQNTQTFRLPNQFILRFHHVHVLATHRTLPEEKKKYHCRQIAGMMLHVTLTVTPKSP